MFAFIQAMETKSLENVFNSFKTLFLTIADYSIEGRLSVYWFDKQNRESSGVSRVVNESIRRIVYSTRSNIVHYLYSFLSLIMLP